MADFPTQSRFLRCLNRRGTGINVDFGRKHGLSSPPKKSASPRRRRLSSLPETPSRVTTRRTRPRWQHGVWSSDSFRWSGCFRGEEWEEAIGGAEWDTHTSVPGGPDRGVGTRVRGGRRDSMRIRVSGAGEGTSSHNVLPSSKATSAKIVTSPATQSSTAGAKPSTISNAAAVACWAT